MGTAILIPYVTTRARAKHGTLALSRLVEAGVEEWKGGRDEKD